MIAYLKGNILKKFPKSIILNTGHVGYLVNLSEKICSDLKENQEIEFYIHSSIREDAFDLFGFLSFEELELFRQLISVNGIGPKSGMEFLNFPIGEIKSAIINENLLFLKQVPGVGKKTAERVILELKSKITIDNLEDLASNKSNIHEDIFNALLQMGYKHQQIHSTLKNLPTELTAEAEIISFFLKNA